MSVYSENYSKMLKGYNKILRVIKSVEIEDEMSCIPTLINNWVNMVDKWCNEVYHDRSIRGVWNKKRESSNLGNAGMKMFTDIKNEYQKLVDEFTQDEYTGSFQPVRIKGLQELAQ